MYVRWQSRKRRRPNFGYSDQQDVHWSAVLVENKRVNGKPVQRHIAYLVGFTDSQAAIPPQRRFLWDAFRARLDRLGSRVSPQDRRRIEAALIEKIGRPATKRQRDKFDRDRRALGL